ncbi:MAG: FRG domain-containing protein [Acidobacteriota bacterium]
MTTRDTTEVVAESWSHLFSLLFEPKPSLSTGRFRSRFVFRGVADARYVDLPTSLQRLTPQVERLPKLETKLIRAFKKYAYLDGPDPTLTWEWLSVAQHYGLPTRLLDWTWSPLVALHFAADKHFERDGVIWMVDFAASMGFLPEALVRISDIESTTMFSTSMLQATAPTLEEFDALRRDDPFVVFFEPPSLDARIANQYGSFSVMAGVDTRLETWLQDRPQLFKKVIVPAAIKWEVRDKIDQSNITERVLFPGLDGLARWLRRYYGPGGAGST